MSPITVRAAHEGDVATLHALIVALAEYEGEPDAVTGTAEMLERWLFGERPAAEALIAEVDGDAVGFALFHGTFSTWECAPGIWLEDLFVLPSHREAGVGGALFARVAALTVERGCTRLGWAALNWNEPALRFYRRRGAAVLEEWKLHRLSGDALTEAAARAAG